MEKNSFQKELVGFEANNDILHITSNNKFIITYDICNNLLAYEFQSSKQKKMDVSLPQSKITDIKLDLFDSLFIISFEDASLILLDAYNPNKIISKYNYYDSIDEKEKDKLIKSNQSCFFRNISFVDNNSFIVVLQKGPISHCCEQIFKFAIAQSDESNYIIINYCDFIKFSTDKESRLIGNPLKIFEEHVHIIRISSILVFNQQKQKDDQKAFKLPKLVGISLKKQNKFLIASVNDFHFQIIQSFTADDSISSFAIHQGTNRINVAFTSYSFHMIFVKALTIPDEKNQKITIDDVCTIKLPVIICSNLRSLSFISPDLISIVFTSPGKLNTSIYSINEGKIIGILPPVLNTNLYLNSNLSVAATFTNDTVFLISKGSALSFSNKDMSELAVEGKFVPEKIDDYFDQTSLRSSSLIAHYNTLNVKKKEGDEQEKKKKPDLLPVKSQKSSNLISFWNSFQSKDGDSNEKTLNSEKSKEKIKIEKEKNDLLNIIEKPPNKEDETARDTHLIEQAQSQLKSESANQNEAPIEEQKQEKEEVKDGNESVSNVEKSEENKNETSIEEQKEEVKDDIDINEENVVVVVEEEEEDQYEKDNDDDSNSKVSEEDQLQKFKADSKIVEGIEYLVSLYSQSASHNQGSNRVSEIKSHSFDFLNAYIQNELNKEDLDMPQLAAVVIDYCKQLNIVDEWLLSESVLSTFSQSGLKFRDFLYAVITKANASSRQIVTSPFFVHCVAQNCGAGFHEEAIEKFLLDLIPDILNDDSLRVSFIKEYLMYAKSVNSPSFAGDVYCCLLHDYPTALKCYEMANESTEKMSKIIVDHSSSPAVINWLFACLKGGDSGEVSFPRLSKFLTTNKNESESLQILKNVLEAGLLYSNLTVIINVLLSTFSMDQISSQNVLYAYIEKFMIGSFNQINVLSKVSLEYLLSQTFSDKEESHESLLLALLNAKDEQERPIEIFPSSVIYPLFLKCKLFGYRKAQEALVTNNKSRPNFCIQIFIDEILSFIENSPAESDTFEAELDKRRKELYDYIAWQYAQNEEGETKAMIEKVISKNIINLICIFSLPVGHQKQQPESTDQSYLQDLLCNIFTEDFTCHIFEQLGENDEIRTTFIHHLILSGIEKSEKLNELVAANIIGIVPFFLMNPLWRDDVKNFIIISSQRFQDNKIICDCLKSPKFLQICEIHFLFHCCCLLCILNNDTSDKCILYLQQLILSLNSKDFTYSQFSTNLTLIENPNDSIDDQDEDDEFRDSSFFDYESSLSHLITLIGKIKYNIDVVKLTAYKLFQNDLSNAWKAFMRLVDVFVNVIKKQSDDIGTYYFDDVIVLFHDICYIMSSNEKNNVDFCEIIRVSRESFACLCESLRNKVIKNVISNQIFSAQTIKTIEKNILERPSHQRSIIKQAKCARCNMPLFIDGIGVYMFGCGHGVHNLAYCRKNGFKCQICSSLH